MKFASAPLATHALGTGALAEAGTARGLSYPRRCPTVVGSSDVDSDVEVVLVAEQRDIGAGPGHLIVVLFLDQRSAL